MNVTWPFALATATNLMTHRAVSGTEDAASTACTVLAYATFHAVCCASDYLSDAFVDLDFNFFGKELDGQSELKPRWKRVVRHADSLIGELVGKAYVAAHFPEHSKVAAELLVGNVTAAVKARLTELPWMGAATKAKALEKMDGSRVKIGYPDAWICYDALSVDGGVAYYQNVQAAKLFAHTRMLDRIDSDVDRERWFMAPQQVNAYYHPQPERDRLPCSHPAAALLRRRRRRRRQLRQLRRGGGARDDPRLRRPGLQVRFARRAAQLVDQRRSRKFRYPSQGDGGPGTAVWAFPNPASTFLPPLFDVHRGH